MSTQLQQKITLFVSLPLVVLLAVALLTFLGAKFLGTPTAPVLETALVTLFLLLVGVALVRAVVPLFERRKDPNG